MRNLGICRGFCGIFLVFCFGLFFRKCYHNGLTLAIARILTVVIREEFYFDGNGYATAAQIEIGRGFFLAVFFVHIRDVLLVEFYFCHNGLLRLTT